MKINENQVETKLFAGKSGDGSPLVYLVTKGGLHAILRRLNRKPSKASPLPHIVAIANDGRRKG